MSPIPANSMDGPNQSLSTAAVSLLFALSQLKPTVYAATIHSFLGGISDTGTNENENSEAQTSASIHESESYNKLVLAQPDPREVSDIVLKLMRSSREGSNPLRNDEGNGNSETHSAEMDDVHKLGDAQTSEALVKQIQALMAKIELGSVGTANDDGKSESAKRQAADERTAVIDERSGQSSGGSSPKTKRGPKLSPGNIASIVAASIVVGIVVCATCGNDVIGCVCVIPGAIILDSGYGLYQAGKGIWQASSSIVDLVSYYSRRAATRAGQTLDPEHGIPLLPVGRPSRGQDEQNTDHYQQAGSLLGGDLGIPEAAGPSDTNRDYDQVDSDDELRRVIAASLVHHQANSGNARSRDEGEIARDDPVPLYRGRGVFGTKRLHNGDYGPSATLNGGSDEVDLGDLEGLEEVPLYTVT